MFQLSSKTNTSFLNYFFIQGLITIHKKVQSLDDVAATKCDAVRRVWVAMHDEDEVVKDLAIDLWKKLRYKALSSICTELLVSYPPQCHATVKQQCGSDPGGNYYRYFYVLE